MAAATAATLPFFIVSLLIFFISCSQIISCFAIATTTHEGQGQGQVPSSVTPKAAAVHYWHLKIPGNKPLPPVFLSKLSSISGCKLFTTNDETMRAMGSGDEAKMEKIDSQNAFIYSIAPQDLNTTATAGDDPTRDNINYSHNNMNDNMVTGTDELKAEKAAEQNRPNPRGTFYFRESELKEGNTISSLKFVSRGSSQYFLPRSTASKIPFSASAVSKILHVPTNSVMYGAMKTTIRLCRMLPDTGETKQCVTSAEDMIDYALSTLGANANIQVWSTHNLNGFDGKSLIGKVKVVYDGELTGKNHATCHKQTFPYLVYACHNVFKSRIYDLEILDAETKEKINQGAAICHLDTSAWSPDQASFAELGSAPGKIEVCHWIAPWDMVWSAGPVAE